MPRGPRTGIRWRQAREWVIDTYDTCCLCKQAVDKTIPYRDPNTGRVNIWSKTVHHLDPLATGGDLLNRERLRLAHLHCNSSAGANTAAQPAPSIPW